MAAPGVLGNDTDVDSPTLTAVLVSGPAHASSFTLNANGSFSYTPAANYNGLDSFTYKANDGSLDSNVATVTITVNAVNDAPVAATDAYSTDEDTTLTVAAPRRARERHRRRQPDPDSRAGQRAGACCERHPQRGSFSYTPAANYNGSDSFTYKANDGSLDSNVATVTITVNAVKEAPVATADAYSTDEDTTLTVAAPAVLGNDTDVDGDTLTAVLVAGPTHAAAFTLNANGSFSYTPAANFNGADSFTYRAKDPSGAYSNVATVTITVSAVNDAPVVTSLTVIPNSINENDSAVRRGEGRGRCPSTGFMSPTVTVNAGPRPLRSSGG